MLRRNAASNRMAERLLYLQHSTVCRCRVRDAIGRNAHCWQHMLPHGAGLSTGGSARDAPKMRRQPRQCPRPCPNMGSPLTAECGRRPDRRLANRGGAQMVQGKLARCTSHGGTVPRCRLPSCHLCLLGSLESFHFRFIVGRHSRSWPKMLSARGSRAIPTLVASTRRPFLRDVVKFCLCAAPLGGMKKTVGETGTERPVASAASASTYGTAPRATTCRNCFGADSTRPPAPFTFDAQLPLNRTVARTNGTCLIK